MKQLKIERIIQKRFGKINESFEEVRLQGSYDNVRIFRVKVKKVSAFLYLINTTKLHGNTIKLPQKIASVYQLFGKIRTLEVQQDLMQKTLEDKKIKLPEIYAKYLAEQILYHNERLFKYVKGPHPFRTEEEKLLKSLPGHITSKDIQQFIESTGDAIEKLLAPPFPADKAFHEARLLLKTLLYLSPYLEMDISMITPYHLLGKYDDINGFTVILGGFNDLCTAIDSLHASARTLEIDENEKIILRNLESLWLSEKEVFRKKIYDDLHEITASGRSIRTLEESLVL